MLAATSRSKPITAPLSARSRLERFPITSSQYAYELQQDWARTETYEGMMDIQRAHSPYGIQIRFSKWALGEHASEGGAKAG